VVSNAHEKRSDPNCSQGGVYYAFFPEDERPNFEQQPLNIKASALPSTRLS